MALEVLEARQRRLREAFDSICAAIRNDLLAENESPRVGALAILEPIDQELCVTEVFVQAREKCQFAVNQIQLSYREEQPREPMALAIRWINRIETTTGPRFATVRGAVPPHVELANRYGAEWSKISRMLASDQRLKLHEHGAELRPLKALPTELRLGVKLSHQASRPRAFYSLWHERSPVFQVCHNVLRFLACERADEVIAFDVISLHRIDAIHQECVKPGPDGLSDGEFCVDSGRRIPVALVPHVARVFQAVADGEQVLGRDTSVVTKTLRPGGGTGPAVRDRPWSQQYLSTLKPAKVLEGELRGSGNRYVAFRFGRLIVVEFDAEAHATYLFRADRFATLRDWPRQHLLDQKPKGFLGRLIHREDPETWKANILQAIRSQG
jgi:hypothetical protein